MIFLHRAHLLVCAAVLSLSCWIKGCDVRPVAWTLVSVHEDLSAVGINLASELEENLPMHRFPGSGGLQEDARSRFQAGHGLNQKRQTSSNPEAG